MENIAERSYTETKRERCSELWIGERVCREKGTTRARDTKRWSGRERERENEEASLAASNPREAPGYPSAPSRNLFLMKWRFRVRSAVLARFSGNPPRILLQVGASPSRFIPFLLKRHGKRQDGGNGDVEKLTE